MVLVTVVDVFRHWATALTGHTTGTVMVQPAAGKVALLRLTVLVPFTALSIPPVHVVVTTPFTTTGAGNRSCTLSAEMGADGLLRLLTVIVSVTLSPAATLVGVNALDTLAGRPQAPPEPAAARNAGAILPRFVT